MLEEAQRCNVSIKRRGRRGGFRGQEGTQLSDSNMGSIYAVTSALLLSCDRIGIILRQRQRVDKKASWRWRAVTFAISTWGREDH